MKNKFKTVFLNVLNCSPVLTVLKYSKHLVLNMPVCILQLTCSCIYLTAISHL